FPRSRVRPASSTPGHPIRADVREQRAHSPVIGGTARAPAGGRKKANCVTILTHSGKKGENRGPVPRWYFMERLDPRLAANTTRSPPHDQPPTSHGRTENRRRQGPLPRPQPPARPDRRGRRPARGGGRRRPPAPD